MISNHSPHVVSSLRHWAVAGVAALMAVAWVAITLVVPSAADEQQTRNVASSQVDLGVRVQPQGAQGQSAYAVNSIQGRSFSRLPGLPQGGLTQYTDGTTGVCFERNVVGANRVGPSWTFAGLHSGLAQYSNFHLSVTQQRMVRALSYYYRTLQSGYAIYPRITNGSQYVFDYGSFQRVSWAISSGLQGIQIRGDLTRGEQYQRQKAQALWKMVWDDRMRFQTNAEILSSLKLQIKTVAQGQQLVRLVGSDQAIQALREAGLGGATLVVNGHYLSVAQALSKGVLIDGTCVNGRTTISAHFSADMMMEGMFAVVVTGGYRDQIKLVLGQRKVHIGGSAAVSVSCGVPPTETTTVTTPSTTPTTPSTTPTTPSTTPTTPGTPSTTPTTPVTTPTTPGTPSTTPTTPTTPGTPGTPSTTPTTPVTTVTTTPPPPATTGFTVRKQAAIGAPGVNVPKSFSFDYYCGDHAPGISDWRSLGALTAGASGRHVDHVKIGSTCYVRESNADVAGSRLVRSWSINGVAVPANSADLLFDSQSHAVGIKFRASGGSDAQIDLINRYSPMGGKLLLSKKLVDGTADHVAPKKVTLRYVCATGADSSALVAEGTHTVTANGAPVQVGKVLPAGTVCAVSENDAAVAGTSLATSWSVDGRSVTPADITWGGRTLRNAVRSTAIANGATVRVTANNTYMDRRAGFSLVKIVKSTDQRLKDVSFTFSYSCVTGNADPVRGRFSLKAGDTFLSSTDTALRGLRKGSTCTITEQPHTVRGMSFQNVAFDRVSSDGASFHVRQDAPASLVFTLTRPGNAVAFSATNSYKPIERTPNPKIGTVLAGPDGVKTVDLGKAGESVQFTDTVAYEGLLPGQKYYLQGKLVDAAGTELGISAVSKPFVPQGGDGALVSGTQQMVFTVPKLLLVNQSKVIAFERLWAATDLREVQPGAPGVLKPLKPDADPPALHEDVSSLPQTVVIAQPPRPQAKAHVDLVKRVKAQGVQVPLDKDFVFDLTCGQKGDANFVSQSLVVRADKTVSSEVPVGLSCRVTEKDAPINGVPNKVVYSVTGTDSFDAGTAGAVSFKVPAEGDAHVEVVAENRYTHKVPKPQVGTTATSASNNAKQVPYGVDANLRDVMTWSDLPTGSYVMVPRLVRNVNGHAVDVPGVEAAGIPFNVSDGEASGQISANIAVPAEQVTADSAFVVYERVYRADQYRDGAVVAGSIPVASHEDITDQGQTVTVGHKHASPVAHVIVRKTVSGTNTGHHLFKFTIKCTGIDGAGAMTTNAKVAAGQSTKPVQAIPGGKCEVSEDRAAAKVSDSASSVTWAADDGVTLVTEDPYKVSFRVPKSGGEVTVTARNSYVPPSTTVTPTPVTPTTPCATPVKPGMPTGPGTPTGPGCPPSTTVTPTPVTPTTPCATPVKPGMPTGPGTPTGPGCPPSTGGNPTVSTEARDGFDGDQFLIAGKEATIKDTVKISGLAAGQYTLVGVLMDKDTGAPVWGASVFAPVTFTVTGSGDSTQYVFFKVPAGVVKTGSRFVAFESVYKAEQVDRTGRVLSGVPVVDHHSITDEAQTVSVSSHRVVPPAPSYGAHISVTPLAKTGVGIGMLTILLGGLVLVGVGILRLRSARTE